MSFEPGFLRSTLDDVLVTDELARRHSREPNYEVENRALIALHEVMADAPDKLLRKLAETALELCQADSAGVSIFEAGEGAGMFRWHAIAGQFAENVGGGMPRDASPCGIVLDRDAALLFAFPERHFDFGMAIEPPIVETLLAPFHFRGKPVGTVWVIAHTPARKFDREDQRLLTSLSRVASAAQQMIAALRVVEEERAESERKVQNRTQQLRRFLDTSATGLSSLNREPRYLEANEAYAQLAGMPRDQIVGRPMVEVLGVAGLEKIRPYFERALRGERVEYESEVPFAVSGPRWLHVVYTPDRDDQGDVIGWVASITDITELKRAEQALRQSEGLVRALIANFPGGVFAVDHHLRILLASGEAMRKEGIEPSSLVGKLVPQGSACDNDPIENYRKALAGETFVVEHQVHGSHYLTQGAPIRSEQGEIIAALAVSHDITERKRAEQALKESQEKLSLALRAANLGTWFFNIHNRHSGADSVAKVMHGFREDEEISCLELGQRHVHPDDISEIDRRFDHAVKTGGVYENEYRIILPDGGIRWIYSMGKVLNDSPFLCGTVQDITQSKQAKIAFQQSLSRAELLSSVIGSLLTSADPQTVVQQLCDEVREFLHCAVFFNYLLDETNQRLNFNACGGVDPRLAKLVEGLELAGSLCGTAARDGCRVLAENLKVNFDARSELVRSMGVRAYACHPLFGPNNQVLGTLSFGAIDRDVFSEEDLALMKSVTHHVAIAMLRKSERAALAHLNQTLEEQVAERTASLEDRQERLAAILNAAADAIITFDHSGVIQSVNPAAEGMFGYTSAEMIAQNVNLLMPAPYHDEHGGNIDKHLNTGIKRIIGIRREVAARRRDGTTFPIELSVTELAQLKQFCAIIRDISRRRELEREVVEIASLEQRRIGQDLHDTVGQELTAIGLLFASQCEIAPTEHARATELARRIADGVRRCTHELRAVMRGLCPVSVDALGLMAALADLAVRTQRDAEVACTFDCSEPVAVADNLVATHLYLIAQEAVHNAIKYARPGHIRISLDTNQCLKLRVEDDGGGILKQDQRGNNHEGLGLRIMRNRAAIIGATLTIEPAQPSGLIVECILPGGGRG